MKRHPPFGRGAALAATVCAALALPLSTLRAQEAAGRDGPAWILSVRGGIAHPLILESKDYRSPGASFGASLEWAPAPAFRVGADLGYAIFLLDDEELGNVERAAEEPLQGGETNVFDALATARFSLPLPVDFVDVYLLAGGGYQSASREAITSLANPDFRLPEASESRWTGAVGGGIALPWRTRFRMFLESRYVLGGEIAGPGTNQSFAPIEIGASFGL